MDDNLFKQIEEAKADLEKILAGSWKEDIEIARAAVQLSLSQVDSIKINLERLIVREQVAPGRVAVIVPSTGREGQAVADPYYGDETNFETTWADVSAGARGLLRLIAGN